jgi:hypothetical protein
MAYKGGLRDSNSILDRHIPLWLTVHEAGHLIARIQLVAAWNLAGLDNPSSFESIRLRAMSGPCGLPTAASTIADDATGQCVERRFDPLPGQYPGVRVSENGSEQSYSFR